MKNSRKAEGKLPFVKISVLILAFLLCSMAAGCSKKIQPAVQPGYEKTGIRLIAVMPVENKTSDSFMPPHLREAISTELFIKGYPRIPFAFIDTKAASARQLNELPPQAAGELIGADALIYPVLDDIKTSYRVIQASTSISASFTLKSAKTGETIWKKEHRISVGNFDFTKKRLEMKSCLEIEPALQEMARNALVALPNGPDYMGKPPEKHAFWDWF